MKLKLLATSCCLLLLSLSPLALYASHRQATPTVWDVLRKQFKLDHNVNRQEVQAQLKWLIKHPDYLKRFAQSEPYMYHILSEVRKRNLPGEIALVPIIESAYDPFAYSHAGAAGLWQIMPETGTDFGLKNDWWVEPRRSVTPSTEAALKYYTYLNKFFSGNWLLAFAAYDSGEGNVSRAVRRTGKTRINASFWALKLPQETKTYVPRLLALAEIINHPNRYHIELPNLLYKPYFEEVEIGQQINLSHAAKLADMSYQDFIQLNPGYNRWATAPYAPYKLLLPVEHAKSFMKSLAKLPSNEKQGWSRYKIHAGETLSELAEEHRTTAAVIKNFNHLKSDMLKKDQYVLLPNPIQITPTNKTALTIPDPNIPNKNTYKVVHIVQKKDSFTTLRQKYGVSEIDVRAWNHLGNDHAIQPGQELLIWKSQNAGRYIVKAGDSLGHIANLHKVPMKKILALNPGIKQNLIKPGQSIQLS
ncbi:MAG: LysM peptidoglycan-binding domain-containing protein [Legionella sp.]|nr:LysM peptidoglycan-binding domain-containing protein [Legionella sp.]